MIEILMGSRMPFSWRSFSLPQDSGAHYLFDQPQKGLEQLHSAGLSQGGTLHSLGCKVTAPLSCPHFNTVHILILGIGLQALEKVTHNLFLTMAEIANATAQVIQEQQESLCSLVKAVMHNQIVLDYPLAEQGEICVVANTPLLCVHQQFAEDPDGLEENYAP